MTDEQSAEPLFRDALFHRKRKHGKWDVVDAPHLEAPLADTHAHLQLLDDPALELARCAMHGIGFIGTIVDVFEDGATTFDELDAWCAEARRVAVEIASSAPSASGAHNPIVPDVRVVVGCHPHNAKYYDDALEHALRDRLADPRVSALGEIGLDYHYDFSSRDDQRAAFRRQIRLAREAGLPIALHLREAHDEALAIMREEGFPEAGTLLHCFNLDWATLEPWVEAGCYVALGGALTFKRADDTRQAVKHVPADRLLTETDAPYMTPEPLRGVPCGPAHVVFTASCLAEVRGCEPGAERLELLDRLMENARTLLDREPTAWQRAHANTICVSREIDACEDDARKGIVPEDGMRESVAREADASERTLL